MRTIYLIVLLCVSALLWGCGSQSAADSISDAEASVAAGDFKRARAVQHLVSDTIAIKDLTPSQLCRIALIYMHLAENQKTHYDEDVAVATECYMRALSMDADSITAFRDNMPVSDLPALHTLNELACAITNPVNISDSIPSDLNIDHEE